MYSAEVVTEAFANYTFLRTQDPSTIFERGYLYGPLVKTMIICLSVILYTCACLICLQTYVSKKNNDLLRAHQL